MKDSPTLPPTLLLALRELIAQGRQRALQAVDMVQVQTCWEVGRHIVEFEQGGQARAEYGTRLLPQLAGIRIAHRLANYHWMTVYATE